MEWIAHKLDVFAAAVVIALLAVAGSQGHAFISQYVSRLGGELQTARAQLEYVQTGLRYRLMSDVARGDLEAEARRSTEALLSAYDSVARANVIVRPIALARHADAGVLASTWQAFIPALPRSPGAILYVIIGMVMGLLIYELIKLPIVFLVREPRRRKFRRR